MPIALVVDDNRATANSLCRMLELLGLEARPAYGPRAAILHIERFVPDVVFLDINMPGVTGFDLMTYLKRDPRLDNVYMVVVTSDDQPELAQKAVDTGALTTLIKPVDIDGLEKVLNRIGLVK
ncbi:MAG TPA: response regulator [Anaerolineales bacterium]|nr:response regulator [Anaerolineales bacterium]